MEAPGGSGELTFIQWVYKMKKFHLRIAANTSKDIAVFSSHLFVSQRIGKYRTRFLLKKFNYIHIHGNNSNSNTFSQLKYVYFAQLIADS